jgi:muconolactone delta-isomerase
MTQRAMHLPDKELGRRPTKQRPGRRSFYLGLWLALVCMAQGCAGLQPVADYKPYQERAETQVQGDLRVTVAVPTTAEAEAIYGADLAEKQIQPVWIKVQNAATRPYWFLPSGLDHEYFASSEAAYAFDKGKVSDANQALDNKFSNLQFRNPVMPGATVSGFVLANLDEGNKAVDVDLVSRMDAKSFTFFTSDPSFRADHKRVDFAGLYDSDALIETEDEDELRRALARLPCCTTNEDGTENGDPLNLVLVGKNSDIFPALIRRQWNATEVTWSGSLWRTVSSFLWGSRYRYSPISPLYAFGRSQDIGAQKVRGSIHERNHMRFWLSPIRFRGEQVWIGQISRDVGVKFTLKSPTISTHVIDPDVDEARRYLIEDLAYSQALYQIGFVKGVGEAGRDAPRTNLVGDSYYTDGLRAVLFFGPRPSSLADLAFLDWDVPVRDASAVAKPATFDDTTLRARATTKTNDGVRVSAALPDGAESRAIFGIDLAKHDVQAVWLEVENRTDRQFWFLPTSVDPEYFAPLEVAFAYHRRFSGEANAELDQRLQALSFDSRRPILPGSVASGFVFASHPRPARALDVDLVGERWSRSLSMIVGTRGAERVQDRLERAGGAYAATELVRIDNEERLRTVLETLPCCTADKTEAAQGVPLNLILIGDLEAWIPAFVRRGYREATTSAHYVFGRPQDIAAEKQERWVAAQPHVVRIWHTPIRYGGKPVWIAQASAPLGGRFASAAAGTRPPPIAPQVDDARNALVQDLLYSQAVTKFGFVDGGGQVRAAEPRKMSDGSSYPTDGLRAVVVFDRRPVALSQIQLFDWERP